MDLTHVWRFERLQQRFGERFVRRFLSNGEVADWRSSVAPARFLASRWAAKEALAKAVGGTLEKGLLFCEVEVESPGSAAPRFRALSEAWKQVLLPRDAHLSISHDEDATVAMVVIFA